MGSVGNRQLEVFDAFSYRTPISTTSLQLGHEAQDIWARLSVKDRTQSGTIEELNISDISTWQRVVNRNGIDKAIQNEEPQYASSDVPIVLRYKGQNILMDGNHRVVVAWLRGKRTMKVRVISV